MKLVVTIVTHLECIEDAISEYRDIEDKHDIVSAKLDGEDWHPSLESPT